MSALTRAEQDAILRANGVNEVRDDEVVIFDGDDLTAALGGLLPAPTERRGQHEWR